MLLIVGSMVLQIFVPLNARFVNTMQKINVFIKLCSIVRVYGFQCCKRIVQNWWKIIVM